MEVDMSTDQPLEIAKRGNQSMGKVQSQEKYSTKNDSDKEPKFINCLRNEVIIVEFVPSEKGLITDPRHVLYGGLGETSKRRFVVPQIASSGAYKNVLTNSEKEFLEAFMGLPDNALSIYKEKETNYWTNLGVTLGKEPTFLDLSVPEDYIKYKILLVNTDFISPSKKDLETNRKATYQFVMSIDGQNEADSVAALNVTSEAYVAFRNIQDDLKKLAIVIEIATGRTVSKIDKKSVWVMADAAIKDSPAKFLQASQDEYLDTKILIKEGVNTGHIKKRQAYYYLTEGNVPMCTEEQEPTLLSACQFLNAPKNQEVLLLLQHKING